MDTLFTADVNVIYTETHSAVVCHPISSVCKLAIRIRSLLLYYAQTI